MDENQWQEPKRIETLSWKNFLRFKQFTFLRLEADSNSSAPNDCAGVEHFAVKFCHISQDTKSLKSVEVHKSFTKWNVRKTAQLPFSGKNSCYRKRWGSPSKSSCFYILCCAFWWNAMNSGKKWWLREVVLAHVLLLKSTSTAYCSLKISTYHRCCYLQRKSVCLQAVSWSLPSLICSKLGNENVHQPHNVRLSDPTYRHSLWRKWMIHIQTQHIHVIVFLKYKEICKKD